MSRTCTVCKSPMRSVIESSLALNQSLASISRQTGISEDALQRHARRHINSSAGDANTSQQITTWLQRVDRVFNQAQLSNDWRVSVESIRAALSLLTQRQQIVEEEARQAAVQASSGEPSLQWMDTMNARTEAAIAGYEAAGVCYHCGQQLPRTDPDQPAEKVLPQ